MAINLLTNLIFKPMDITYFNKNFRFVYSSNIKIPQMDSVGNIVGFTHLQKVRFLIGAGQLSNYLGTEKNAETVLKTAEKMKTDKTTVKFRKYGKIEIYVK